MATTLKDYGRNSEKFGQIPYYYGFHYRFWFGQSQVQPEDVETWCRENCLGYYKTVTYTHKKSVRNPDGSYKNRVVYVDKIYLADERDALRIKLAYDVRDVKVMRPRMPRKKKDDQ